MSRHRCFPTNNIKTKNDAHIVLAFVNVEPHLSNNTYLPLQLLGLRMQSSSPPSRLRFTAGAAAAWGSASAATSSRASLLSITIGATATASSLCSAAALLLFSSTAMGDCTAGAGKGNCAANSFPTASRAAAIRFCRYSVLVRLAMKCCVSFCNYGKYEFAEAVMVVSVLDLVSR